MSNNSTNPKEDLPKTSLEITANQSLQLTAAFELLKVISSPYRLALLGRLAEQPKESWAIDDLKEQISLAKSNFDRELDHLIQVGLVQVEEWHAVRAGHEPRPAQVSFNQEFLSQISQTLAALAQINRQLHPSQSVSLDERAKTLGTFFRDGKLTGLPTQYKRQVYVLEEVARQFEPGLRYSERQVDDILKQLYEYDHCTLRRALIDLHLLNRQDGIYWKADTQTASV